MKKTKLSIVKVIAVLTVLFSAYITRAQAPPVVVPYPNTEDGQRLTINESSPYWQPLMEVSALSRDVAQTTLNEGGNPDGYWKCNTWCCCETKAEWCYFHQRYEYKTICFIGGPEGAHMDTIE